MSRTATLILNRNLPKVTENLYDLVKRNNPDSTDIYVIESGSDEGNLCKYTSWWANWPEAIEHGLRYPRGFNYGLSNLLNENKFSKYDYFFLLTNDCELDETPFIDTLASEMESHPNVGILIPCSRSWGERKVIGVNQTRYVGHAHFMAWFMRREFIECIMEQNSPNYMNFIFDATNFRGYISDIEIIAKGYANDWATALTTKVQAEENEEHLKNKVEQIKTEPDSENREKIVKEGQDWMRRKYGFNYRWSMQIYAKAFFDRFFESYPMYEKFKI